MSNLSVRIHLDGEYISKIMLIRDAAGREYESVKAR